MSRAKAGNVRGRERATVKYHITRTALMLFYATVIRIFLWSEHLSSISVVFRSPGWENREYANLASLSEAHYLRTIQINCSGEYI